jgi:hypothetical protein
VLFWHHFLVEERVQVTSKNAKQNALKTCAQGELNLLALPSVFMGVGLAFRLHQNNYPLNWKISFHSEFFENFENRFNPQFFFIAVYVPHSSKFVIRFTFNMAFTIFHKHVA